MEDLGVAGRKYENGSLRNGKGNYGLDAQDSGQRPVAASCEHGNESLCCINER
jgi:hypothetical protein